MKTKLALGLLTIAATLITSGAALAQQSDSRQAMKAESAANGSGDPYSACQYFSPSTKQTAGEALPASDPLQSVAARYMKEAAQLEARAGKRADSTSSDTGRYDYYKDLAPFGE